jgi:NAD(P)-dependent dehydrogenase (short-subunit alcohol dehydrogenase family)
MIRVQLPLRRTVAALVVGLNTGGRIWTAPTAAGSTMVGVDGIRSSPLPSRRGPSRQTNVRFSTFAAPEPPASRGTNVFRDIDFTVPDGPASQRRADPDAVFVVNGASRGIGLQFVRTLLDRTEGRVVACCRSPGTAEGLKDLVASAGGGEGRLAVVALDVEDQASVDRAVADITSRFGRVDLLLNVAGILGDGVTTPGPERSLSNIDRAWMDKTFQVNVIGPVMFSKGLVPLMSQKRRGKDPTRDGSSAPRPNAVIANLSARVGSISDNGLGGWYSYRMSKAALNQATRTLAHELKRQSVWCVALHPGTTDTDLSKPFQRNVQEGRLFPVEFTVESLMRVIDSLQDENSGGLYDWAGKAIPF